MTGPSFAVGDVVWLNSDANMRMTIVRIEGEFAAAAWFEGCSLRTVKDLPLAALSRLKDERDRSKE